MSRVMNQMKRENGEGMYMLSDDRYDIPMPSHFHQCVSYTMLDCNYNSWAKINPSHLQFLPVSFLFTATRKQQIQGYIEF